MMLAMHRQILLTGATGALGPALAAQLACGNAAQRIAVMMRCPPAELGEKFGKWRSAVGEWVAPDKQSHLDRLFPVVGDICQENLGLGDASKTLQRERPPIRIFPRLKSGNTPSMSTARAACSSGARAVRC
jgi:hypothetical protein